MDKKDAKSTPKDNLKCYECHSIIVEKLNCVLSVLLLTEDSDSAIALEMKHALHIIGDYCYKKYYHLSASQILLTRPDIASKAFKQIFKKLIFFGFEFRTLCKPCYNTHMRKNPLK